MSEQNKEKLQQSDQNQQEDKDIQENQEIQKRIESASVSEIEEANLQTQKQEISLPEKIVKKINKFRFKNNNVINKLLSIINPEVYKESKNQEDYQIDRENKQIKFNDIDRIIDYQNDEILNKLEHYLHEMDIFNQILPDFTFEQEFNSKFNEFFSDKFNNQIQLKEKQNKQSYNNQQQKSQLLQNGEQRKENVSNSQDQKSEQNLYNFTSLFQAQNQEQIENFKETFQTNYYYGYNIKEFDLEKMESFIILILIEEFILLNNMDQHQNGVISSKNLSVEIDLSSPPEQLGFLNNIYNAAFINVQEKENNKFDLYILMVYTEALEKLAAPTLRKTFDGKSQFQGNQSIGGVSQWPNGHKNREYLSIIPQKYSSLIKSSTQIPKKSVQNLVKLMDSDGDLKLTVQDIQQFAYKNYLHWNDEIFEKMFNEAASKRRVTYNSQYKKPISIDEILGAVQVHQRLNQDKKWVQLERPFRKYWVQLLQCAGQKIPTTHDLPPINIQPVKDLHQLQLQTQKPTLLNQSFNKTQVKVYNLKKPCYQKPFRAEAGLIINNTEHIKEEIMDKEQYDPNKFEAFEKVVNQQFKNYDDKGNSTISFNTQQYFNEAQRLSKNPALYQYAEKNPIYKFFPENFDFKSNQQDINNNFNENASKQNLLSSQYRQQQKNYGITQSSRLQENPLEEDSSHFDYDEQANLDSLLKTQSILKIGRQLSKVERGIHASTFANHQYSNSVNVIPVSTRNKLREQKMLQEHQRQKTLAHLNGKVNSDLFLASFKPETVQTLKAKLAQKEPVTDSYNPVSDYNFREEVVYLSDKRVWKNRIKPEPMDNPYGISSYDTKPKEVIERELREHEKQKRVEELRQRGLKEQDINQKDWTKYFVLPDREHQLGNLSKRHDLFPREQYKDPTEIATNNLRGEANFKIPFKLFFK
ncbi:hypothetical protein PPERSA_04772 [Pseudocohnilembus persalinus]|uniref:EF-hand domain-containing protein n=1 Tax=Pseudocohnilembus persalinus TaxID=266149 RepID=A0A0V0QNQ5_PSEPJ|nr:hypothetical protein PPERSA_04772 [Pseudocohnilembus persalinus]|eukprot:KRX03894.1 hypothetical protein PPERSA_04772 [Pseudocohnilembus persalinus]